ncbi:A/B/D/E cyclin, partial [Aureobasidium melanogenum]
MDAKPQRPQRPLRVHDENALPSHPVTAKGTHQRNKSSTTLPTLMQNGAVRPGAKRAVFADVSNTIRTAPLADDAVKAHDNGKAAAIYLDPLVLSKPAQKPLAVKNITTSIVPTAALPTISKVQPKKSAPVLRDLAAPTVDEIAVGETETVPEAALDEVKTQQQVTVVDNTQEETAIATVQPPQVLTSQEAVVVDTNALEQFAPETEEKVVVLSQSLMTVNDDEYDEDYEEELYEGSQTVTRGGATDNTTGGATVVLCPKHTAKTLREIEEARQVVENTRTAEDIEDDQWDTSMVAEYGDEIFEYMRTLEERMRPNAHYMDYQNECQWSMRSVLMDWMIQVHTRFTLLPETLFLAVNYIDRFLSCKVISLGKLQLVGATAIFLAAKYEEVNCPSVQEVVYMVDGGYTQDEILKAERYMLSMLSFELGWPGPMSFLRRISKADDYDLETRTLAKYFLEITIMDERFVGCTPSFLAAGAHCLARLMLRKGEWTQAHVYYSNYTYAQIRQLLAVMVECCETPDVHHNAVFHKYQDRRFKRASLFVQTEMKKGFKLPVYQRATSIGYKGW